MKAVVLRRVGAAKTAWDFTTFEKPKPKSRDILVQIKAIGVVRIRSSSFTFILFDVFDVLMMLCLEFGDSEIFSIVWEF